MGEKPKPRPKHFVDPGNASRAGRLGGQTGGRGRPKRGVYKRRQPKKGVA